MIRERAYAKVNLILQVGDVRPDGLHELCSLFAALDLADDVRVEPADADRVVCAGVEGPNIADRAIAELRAALGGELPPLHVEIDKRIPVAAGLGGGSADAAAVLRAGNAIAGARLTSDELRAIGARLGADVPSQIDPRHAVVTGAGERVDPVDLPPLALLLVPQAEGLSTADVYREADRIGATRARLDPDGVRAAAADPIARLENDLEAAALSLRPELAGVLEELTNAGALAARITGSGPTAFGVFATREYAERSAAALSSEALVTVTLQPSTSAGP